MHGLVHQINVKPKVPGQRGLPKTPVDSAFISRRGVVGDYNVYRQEERKGDPDSAILLFPMETIRELTAEGWPINPGDLGENLTTSGIQYSDFTIGTELAIGDARLQVSRACDPCDNLFLLPYVGPAKGPAFLKTMLGRRGWYARVLVEGSVKKGDAIMDATG